MDQTDLVTIPVLPSNFLAPPVKIPTILVTQSPEGYSELFM